VHERSHDQYAQ